MVILKNNVEVDNTSLKESGKVSYDENVQADNLGPDKRVYNEIFLIVSYEYNNDIFLLWQYRTSNVYTEIGICNICYEYMIYESEKTRV